MSFTLPHCCWRHRLWSTDARKFPALILLTFTVTRHFSAWRSSTHSVTDAARLSSARRGALALPQIIAQVSGSAAPECQHASKWCDTFGLNNRNVKQDCMCLIVTLHNTFLESFLKSSENNNSLEIEQFRIQSFLGINIQSCQPGTSNVALLVILLKILFSLLSCGMEKFENAKTNEYG